MPDSYVTRLVKVAAILLTLILPHAKAEAKTILTFGDSLTAGYGVATAESFPVLLEAALRQNGAAVRVLNAGVSGDTAAGPVWPGP